MSDFLGRVGWITEWVVVSNLGNRAVNAACDKAQGWWKNRKQNKNDSHAKSTDPPPPSQIQSPPSFPPYQAQQASYMPPPPAASYPPPSMGCNQLLVTVNNVEGLNQWGPLVVIIECNHQRYQTSLGQYQQQFSLPIYQFDYDQLLIWIQTEYQQQTIAHAEIPIRILLNDNNNWNAQPHQRWIPLRDHYNGPAGQLLVNVEYRASHPSGPSPPPPYSYYP